MLHSIYNSGDYPFIYTALVGDANLKAYDRLTIDYNFAGYPSCFFDAGYKLFIGGTPTESYFRDKIEECGLRTVTPLDLIVKLNWVSNSEIHVSVAIGNDEVANYTPNIPSTPSGISTGDVDTEYIFQTQAIDLDGNDLWYQFDWGDGSISDWIGPTPSGNNYSDSHIWTANGTYTVKVRSKDSWDYTSDWSSNHSVMIGCCIDIRGNIDAVPTPDVPGSGGIDIADLVYLVSYSFQGGPPPACIEEGDVDGSAGVIPIDIADVVYLVAFMFTGGPAPVSCN